MAVEERIRATAAKGRVVPGGPRTVSGREMGSMCGIAGLFDSRGLGDGALLHLRRITGAVAHRGPDGDGVWTDDGRRAALGHRRLAVVDLTEAGAQPMVSSSGRFVLTFNGEIYNFGELRAGLEAAGVRDWRGTSDTEVLLAAVEAWGLSGALRRARGMFALGLWDNAEATLSLARDAIGEKPLYVGRIGRSVAFASELKALTAHPDWDGEIDRDAVALCLRNGHIPAPRSLWRNVRKVMPGTIMVLSAGCDDPRTAPVEAFWDMFAEAEAARQDRFRGSPAEAVDRLEALLSAAVSRQMIADVPLGAFLSGGIDSSTITALMQAASARPVQSFALGFHERDANEAEFAKAIAAHLGTEHHEIYFTGEAARDLVAEMPAVYDEPIVTSSQLPTYLLSGFARQTVTVALSGDAGDELFGGYNRYARARGLWGNGAVSGLRRQIERAGLSALDGTLRTLEAVGAGEAVARTVGASRTPLGRRRRALAATHPIEGYEALFTALESTHDLVPGATRCEEPLLGRIAAERGWSVLEQASFLDMLRYLPDDVLVKLDRAAMAHSLETRLPFLDPDVIRFSFSLPDEIKLMGGEPKGVLRALLARRVPRSLWDRPKKGFGVPVAEWLRGPLEPLAADMFSRETLRRTGILDEARVSAIWQEFRANPSFRPKIVWTLFVTQLYLDRACRPQAAAA